MKTERNFSFLFPLQSLPLQICNFTCCMWKSGSTACNNIWDNFYVQYIQVEKKFYWICSFRNTINFYFSSCTLEGKTFSFSLPLASLTMHICIYCIKQFFPSSSIFFINHVCSLCMMLIFKPIKVCNFLQNLIIWLWYSMNVRWNFVHS